MGSDIERDLSEEPDPTMYILGFVVAFLAGIGGYIYYVNSKVSRRIQEMIDMG